MRGALALLVLALSVFPAVARAELSHAYAALQQGDYAAIDGALRGIPPAQRAEAALIRALAALETGRYDVAAAQARLAGRGAPRAEAITVEGEALAALGRYDEAIARWRVAGASARGWRARGLAAVWLMRLGRDDEAREQANPLLDAFNDAIDQRRGSDQRLLSDPHFLRGLSLATRALGAMRDANRALADALQAYPDAPELHLERAELMRLTEDYAPAAEEAEATLRINPRSASALTLRARLRLLSGLEPGGAVADIDAALAVNPRLPAALALRALIALRDGDPAAADRHLAAAEAVNPRDLDLLAARAARAFHRGDLGETRAALDALHRVAPAWADGYAWLSEVADFEHRYDELVEVLRGAVTRPTLRGDRHGLARVQAALGFNLLRGGDEAAGLAALRESFERSRFNVRVANVLNLYEQVIGSEYVTEDLAPLRLRVHRDDRPVLAPHASSLLRAAWGDMVRRYGFTPPGPVTVELYARREHFSVRTSGVPEVGVQGVCFGRVVTALSPRAGAFNWAQIVWHELAHVFALHRSRSRVPRWFTEGLSEWETVRRDPRWDREDDPALWNALRAGRVPPIVELNLAFTRARSGADMMLAYYTASRLVAFLIERFGFERVISALPLWGEGRSTEEVLERALGAAPEELDRQFREALEARLARYRGRFSFDASAYRDRAALDARAARAPDDADALASASAAAMVAGDRAAAAALAERAIRVLGAQPLARIVRASLALGGRDGRAALAELGAFFEGGADGHEARMREALAARMTRDGAREERALRAAMRLDPTQVEAPRALAALMRRRGRADEEAGALRAVVALDQHDRESLERLQALDVTSARWAEVLALSEHLVHLDPFRVSGQLAVAQAAQETGDGRRALRALDDALRLAPAMTEQIRARADEIRAGRRGMPPLQAPATRGREP